MVTNILKEVTQTAVLIIIVLDNVTNLKTLGINKNRTQTSNFKSLRKLINYQNNSGLKIEKSNKAFHDQEDIKITLEEKYKFRNDQSSTRYRIVNKARRYPETIKRTSQTYNLLVSADKVTEHHMAWFRSYAVRRIVGGMDTSISLYPYNVAIANHGQQWCGGSIIDEQWVLTAGHCLESAYDGDKRKLRAYTVRAGSSFHNKGGYQARINKVFFPQGFSPGNIDYDFSLVRLDRPMPIGRNIAVLNLPSKDFVHEEGDILIITGWGSTNESGLSHIPDRIHFVPVPVIELEKCQKKYQLYLTARMLCAGYTAGGKDACNHDSGGPAVYDGILLGVVSFGGKLCGDPHSPGIYSRVSVITEFVHHTIKNNEANTVPELMPKIKRARQRQEELQKYKAKVEEKKNKMRNWFREVIQTQEFIEIAKKKLQDAGLLTRRNLNEEEYNTSNLNDTTMDDINLRNMINERILEDNDSSEDDKLLRILALNEVILNEDNEEKPVLRAKQTSGSSSEIFETCRPPSTSHLI